MGVLINCKKCGRMFSSEAGVEFCSRCRTSEEDEFKIVREYIYNNPNSTINDVHEATEVAREKIMRFLKQGRLMLKETGIGLECEKCGCAITKGRFCDSCALELRKSLNSVLDKAKPVQKRETTKKTKSFHTKN